MEREDIASSSVDTNFFQVYKKLRDEESERLKQVATTVGGLWGGPYLMQVYNLSKTEAGGVLSMFAVALMVGSPFLSWVGNRVGRKPVLIGCSFLLIAVCSLFSSLTDRLTIPVLYLLFFLSLSGAATGPLVAAVSKELFPVAIAGTSVGMVNLFLFLGGALFQVVAGAVLTTSAKNGGGYSPAGYQAMFVIYVLGALISLVAAVLLKETLHREEPVG